jgi:hypothetical protein
VIQPWLPCWLKKNDKASLSISMRVVMVTLENKLEISAIWWVKKRKGFVSWTEMFDYSIDSYVYISPITQMQFQRLIYMYSWTSLCRCLRNTDRLLYYGQFTWSHPRIHIIIYYMASSTSCKDELNPTLKLATRVSRRALSCLLWITRCFLQANGALYAI